MRKIYILTQKKLNEISDVIYPQHAHLIDDCEDEIAIIADDVLFSDIRKIEDIAGFKLFGEITFNSLQNISNTTE